MARPRRNPNQLGSQQNPRNAGLNRAASMRGNNRRQNAFSPGGMQGGLGQRQAPGMAPGMNAQQQQQGQCPVGQVSRPGPDGRPTCVADPNAGRANMPGNQPKVRPGQSGAGTPLRVPKKNYNEGY